MPNKKSKIYRLICIITHTHINICVLLSLFKETAKTISESYFNYYLLLTTISFYLYLIDIINY